MKLILGILIGIIVGGLGVYAWFYKEMMDMWSRT